MGVERRLDLAQHVEPLAQRLGHEPGPVEAHAVVVAQGAAAGQDGPRAGVPGGGVVRLALVGRHLGGEGEVQAATGEVGVRLVRRHSKRARHGGDGGQAVLVDLVERTPGAEISMVSTT